MTQIPALEIKQGLRRLEFDSKRPAFDAGTATYVIVEFVHAARLRPDQVVRINLGIRDGVERILEGLPKRLAPATGCEQENVYRLEAPVG